MTTNNSEADTPRYRMNCCTWSICGGTVRMRNCAKANALMTINGTTT